MIWDLHVHLSPALTAKTPEDRMAQLIKIADRMGIERLCVYMGMSWSLDPAPERFRQENDEVLRAIRKFPDRTFGFVYVNPKHVEASLAELDPLRCQWPNGRRQTLGRTTLLRARTRSDHQARRRVEGRHFQHTWFNATGNKPGESTPLTSPNSRVVIRTRRSSVATPVAIGNSASAPYAV